MLVLLNTYSLPLTRLNLLPNYFQPERIDPKGGAQSNYDVKSDVWSFGISMIEISTGVFPYSTWKTPFDQLRQVVNDAAPRLPGTFSPTYQDFIDRTYVACVSIVLMSSLISCPLAGYRRMSPSELVFKSCCMNIRSSSITARP